MKLSVSIIIHPADRPQVGTDVAWRERGYRCEIGIVVQRFGAVSWIWRVDAPIAELNALDSAIWIKVDGVD